MCIVETDKEKTKFEIAFACFRVGCKASLSCRGIGYQEVLCSVTLVNRLSISLCLTEQILRDLNQIVLRLCLTIL